MDILGLYYHVYLSVPLDGKYRTTEDIYIGSERNMGSSTSLVEIFIPLLNEGTDVLRPTQGFVLGSMEVQVLPTPNYDPTVEEWEFPPGAKVRCVKEIKGSRELLVARQRIA